MRRWIGIWLALVLVLWPQLGWAQQPVTLSVDQAGFDNQTGNGQWMPLTIHLTNAGSDTRGVVRITSRGFFVQEIPVELPGGADKLVHASVHVSFNSNNLTVQFLENNASGVAPNASARVTPEIQPLLGLLFGGARADLADLRTRGALMEVVSGLPADQLPAEDGELYGVGLVGLSDVEVSAEQAAVLERWVAAGGILVIQAGPSTSSFPDPLAALAPASIAETSVQSVQLPDLKEPAQQVRLLNPQPGADVVLKDAQDRAVIVRQRYGLGWVVVSGLDFGRQFTQRVSGGAGVWETALPPRIAVVPFPEVAPWMFNRQLDLPDSGMIALLLLLYVVLVGPVNYLVLKRLDRLELAWFTLPATILLMLGVFFVLAQDLRGGELNARVMSVIQAPQGAAAGRSVGMVMIAPGQRTTLNMALPPGMMAGSLDSQFGDTNEFNFLQNDRQWEVVDQTVNAGETLKMTTLGVQPVPYKVALNISADGSTVELTNTGPAIEQAFVVFDRNSVQETGALAANASFTTERAAAFNTLTSWSMSNNEDNIILQQFFNDWENNSELPPTPFVILIDHTRLVPLVQDGAALDANNLNVYILTVEER